VTRSSRRQLYLIGAALLVVALVGGRWLAIETAERAWNRTFAGGETLIEARLLARLMQTFVLACGVAWATANLLIVYRAIGSVQMPRRLGDLEIVEAVPRRVLFTGTVALGVVVGVFFSLGSGDWWRHAVLASAPPHFGVSDGTLQRDAGYYVGVLPWRAALQNRAFVFAAGILALVALLYGVIGSLRFRRGRIRASDYARAHCGALLACLALVLAWGAVLDPAEVIGGLHGPVDQAALSVRVPGADLVAAVAFVTAIISAAWGIRDRPTLILAGWAALILSIAAVHFVIPGVVRTSGESETGGGGVGSSLARRRQLLERVAFGLTGLDAHAPAPFASGDAAVQAGPLWDPARVAIVAGTSANAVALRVATEPTWLIAPTTGPRSLRIAVETDTGLALSNAPRSDTALLFAPGAPSPGYIIASPDSAPALRVTGIPISGTWRRFALAWTIQAWDMLRGETKNHVLLWRRDVAERFERLVPFADFGTPAPLVQDGALWWVSWGYVSSESFPLVRPLEWRERELRYFRPGLVGAIRVATGETHVWLAPGYDSLTAAWARRFAPMIEPADRLPPGMRAQLAYPAEAFNVSVAQLVRASEDSAGSDAVWTLRPRTPFQLVAPPPGSPGESRIWTGVAFESGVLVPKQFVGLCAGVVTPQGPRLYLWRARGSGIRLPGELLGSLVLKPGQMRIWPVGESVITMQAQFVDPAGVTPPPPPRVSQVFVTLDGRSGRGMSAGAALHGGEQVVIDTSFGARWERARRLAVQADSALGAGDLEQFGRLWRALLRELAPVRRPR
jgi:hypothetical protein